ncbi:MAG: hypothetical protein J7M34_12450, partial [Anaerolineae bacterium]|nr:hypothetical protein [Anaerolineae bacterium]
HGATHPGGAAKRRLDDHLRRGGGYDLRSGMLLTMGYFKRWLFTGTFEGRQYKRQYFGDYEMYEQVLEDTNVMLSPPVK